MTHGGDSRRWAMAMLVGGALALAPACRQIAGVEDRSPPETCSAEIGGDATCGACLRDACCDEASACEGDVPCRERRACLATCSADDRECAADCADATKPTEAFARLRACEARACAAPCGLDCGGPGAVTVCAACGQLCCTDALACASDLDCNLLDVCRGACEPGDTACKEACVNAHPAGASLARSVDECVGRSCDLAADWSCVGSVSPPVPATADIRLDGLAYDGVTLESFAGLQVSACNQVADPGCEAPFATSTTDGEGRASVTVPFELTPYPGYLEVTGPGLRPGLFFLSPPISTSVGLGYGMLRETELQGIAAAAGVTLMEDRGVIILVAIDCRGQRVPHVSFEVSSADAETVTVYSVDDPNAHGAETIETGLAFLFNVPAGPVSVRAKVAPLCRTVGQASLVVRAGALSVLSFPPTP